MLKDSKKSNKERRLIRDYGGQFGTTPAALYLSNFINSAKCYQSYGRWASHLYSTYCSILNEIKDSNLPKITKITIIETLYTDSKIRVDDHVDCPPVIRQNLLSCLHSKYYNLLSEIDK